MAGVQEALLMGGVTPISKQQIAPHVRHQVVVQRAMERIETQDSVNPLQRLQTDVFFT
jgi:hypothetical protein